MENNNPFAKKINTNNTITNFDLGEKTDIPDTQDEDMKKIEKFIPHPGDKSIEEGYQKMLNILQKTAPIMPDIQKTDSTPKKIQKSIENSIFSKQEQEREQKQEQKQEHGELLKDKKDKDIVQEPIKENLMNTSSSDKIEKKTKSEELGLHYEDSEVLPLLDNLLTKGYAAESLNMRGNIITFRTSYLWEDKEVLARIDEELPNYNLKASGSFLYDLYSLASNLEQFGANYFKPLSTGKQEELKESFDERVDFLKSLPSPFVTIISSKRLDFIKKVQFLIDNYDRLLQAF